MLVKYRKSYEKIAMGFLSYLEDFKNMQNLREEMELYQNRPDYEVFLFKHEETSDFEGIVGIQKTPHFVLMRYISLSPAYRTTENALQMLNELQQIFPKDKILSTPENAGLIQKFEDQDNE